MSQLPTISVVVPSFNQGMFLKDALISIVKQYYPKTELIVMDGGSLDNSVDIIKKFSSHITYWQSESDGGQAAAINAGFKVARGEVITWLNADDFYLPDAFNIIAETYAKYPDNSFYFGNGYRVNINGKKPIAFFPTHEVFFNRDGLRYGVDYILQPSTFINAKYISAVNYLDTTLNYGLDWDLWIKLAELAEPLFVPAYLAVSREYETTKTASGAFERIEELRQIAKRYTNAGMTPGVLCYFLHTLSEFAEQNDKIFDKELVFAIQRLWYDASQQLERFGLSAFGFPTIKSSHYCFETILSHESPSLSGDNSALNDA